MADVALVRIDSRLIHGQVATKWLKQVQANRIVVIDNSLAKDPFMKKVYTMAAPPGTAVEILDVATAVSSWKREHLGAGKLIVLFKDVATAASAWKEGFKFSALQVGGLGGAPGRKTVYQNITLSAEDVKQLDEMAKGGVSITFQTIPEDKPATFESVIEKVQF
ncbi:MAG: PTS sugar transporter subunit IIB [Candidatus Fermentithermobacillus carboniphilus]|uniref:PTS sugar transporter subunit IIB n=1 Tax=Candidatus Fermentithermobacillus carboniphilus TaxID=3085328 RepID=A0AAT9LBN5_9FIRM|nr:MAG: PTS sugar transporter subunit IIB [Candidatus Fermentithermobacillus carboniphilus]